MTVYIVGFLDDESDLDLNSLEMNYTSILYVQDKSTGEYMELNRLHGEENRIWVDYENIPDHLIDAAIAGEDRRFKEHQGVDWKCDRDSLSQGRHAGRLYDYPAAD